MLQTKIQRSEAAIDNCLDIAKGCQKHYSQHLEPGKPLRHSKEIGNMLDNYLVDMKRHRVSLKRLNRRLHGALNLVSSTI